MAEAERLEAQPLPEKVVPLTNYSIQTDTGYYIVPLPTLDQKDSYHANGTTKPMIFEFFYRTEINGVQLIVMSLQIKNPDGFSRFLHLLQEAEYFTASSLKNHPDYYDYWLGYIYLQDAFF